MESWPEENKVLICNFFKAKFIKCQQLSSLWWSADTAFDINKEPFKLDIKLTCDYKWLKFGNIPQIKYHSEHFVYCLPSKSSSLKSLPKTEGHPWSQISFEIYSWTCKHQSPLIPADQRQWELEYRVKCEIALSSPDFHIDTHTAPTPCHIRMNKLYS